MATKVNAKFVMIVGGIALVGLVGMAVLATSVLNKSPETYLKEAETISAAAEKLRTEGKKEEANKEFEKAVAAFGKAVSKDQNNEKYLRAWIAAMEKTQPPTRLLYAERYNNQYVRAKQRLADTLRTDVAAHKDTLEPTLYEIRMIPSAAGWNALIQQTDVALRRFDEKDAKRDGLRRYRGMARVGLLGVKFDMNDADREAARADLEAALTADPKDEAAMAALVSWTRFQVPRIIQTTQQEELARKMIEEMRVRAKAFVDANAPAATVLHATNLMDFDEGLRVASRARPAPGATRSPLDELISSYYQRATATLEAFSKTPESKIDPIVLAEAAKFAVAVAVPNALNIGLSEMERAYKARNNDPLLLFNMGLLASEARESAKAVAYFQQLAEMPDRPLSFEGRVLFVLRDLAVTYQAKAVMSALDLVGDDAKRKGLVEQLETFRKTIESRSTGDAELRKTLLLIDGRLELQKNNYASARRLLNLYNEQTNRNDVEALRLLTSVLIQLQDWGAARNQIERLKELGQDSSRTDELLATIELRLGNRSAAIGHLQRAITREQDINRRNSLQQQVDDLQNADSPREPIFKALDEIKRMLEVPEPDLAKARGKVLDLIKTVPDSPLARLQLTILLVQFGETEAARAFVDQVKAKSNPGDSRVQFLESILAAPKDAQALEKVIDDNPQLSPTDRAVQKVVMFMQRNDTERLKTSLEELRKASPEHPIVISSDFELAIRENKFEDARKLADLATAKNADNAGGNIFKAQLATAEKKLDDAIKFAKAATDADKLSAPAHRILGGLYLQQGKYKEGTEALNASLLIRPDDLSTVMTLSEAYLRMGQPQDALRVMRSAKAKAESNPSFRNALLRLETEQGDAREAKKQRAIIFAQNPGFALNTTEYILMLLRDRDFDTLESVIKRLEGPAPSVTAGPAGSTPAGPDAKPGTLAPLFDTLQYRALLLGARGDNTAAIAKFQEAIALIEEGKREGQEHFIFSQIALNNGMPELALSAAELGRQYQKKGNTNLDRMMGDIEFARGNFAQAVVAYQRALDATEKDVKYVLTLRLADTYLRLGKFDKADGLLANVKPEDADNKVNLLLLRSQTEQATKQLTKARATINEVLNLDPRSALGFIRRAEIALGEPGAMSNKKLTDEAAADLETALKLEPLNAPARRLLTTMLIRLGEVDRGIVVIREGLKVDPENDTLRNEVVQLLVELNRVQEAMVVLDEGINRVGDNRQWLAVAGELMERQGQYSQAVEFFARLWERDKTPQTASKYVAMLLAKSPPDTVLAKQILAFQGLGTDRVPILLVLRARANMLDGREAEWTKDARAAWAATDATSLPAVNGYFTALLRQVFRKPGDTKPRLADAERFIETLRPAGGFTEATEFALSIIRFGGDDASKQRAMETLARLRDSGSEPGVRYQAARTMAGEQVRASKFDEALENYNKAEAAVPDTFENLNDIAYVLGKHKGKYAEALPMAERAAEKAPGNIYTLGTLGTIYLGLARYDDAERTLIRARQMGGEPLQKAGPLIRMIELKLAKNEKEPATLLLAELKLLMDQEREPKLIRDTYKAEIQSIEAKLNKPL